MTLLEILRTLNTLLQDAENADMMTEKQEYEFTVLANVFCVTWSATMESLPTSETEIDELVAEAKKIMESM